MNDASGTGSIRKAPRHRRVLRWFAAVLGAVVLSIGAVYAMSAWLLTQLAPRYADRIGLDVLEIEASRPALSGITITTLRIAADGFELSASNGDIDYHWRDLIEGRIDSASFGSATLMLRRVENTSPDGDPTDVETLFARVPVSALRIDSLRLALPDIDFAADGHLFIGTDAMDFEMTGRQPSIASGLRLQAALDRGGSFEARLSDSGTTPGTGELYVGGTLRKDRIDLSGNFSLSDYTLTLVSTLLGLPEGAGSASAVFVTGLPWPIPATMTARDIVATVPQARIDWQAADGKLRFRDVAASLEIDRAELSAKLSGQVIGQINESRVTATLPENYELTVGEGGIEGGHGLILDLRRSGLDLRASLSRFSVVRETTTRLNFDTRIDASLDGIAAAGQLDAGLSIADDGRLSMTGRLNYAGDVSVGTDSRALLIESDIRLRDDILAAEGQLTSDIFDDVSFAAEYALASGAGHFTAEDAMTFARPIAAQLVPGWNAGYDLDSGQVDSRLALAWESTEHVAATLHLDIADAAGHYDDYLASGIAAKLRLESPDMGDAGAWRLETGKAQIATINVGFPITDVDLGFSWAGSRAAVALAAGRLLGGSAATEPFIYDINTGSAEFELALSDLKLADILALEGEDIRGTGQLDGTLPVAIRNNRVRVAGGRLLARAPGGKVRLTPQFSGPTGQPGLDFALLALKDFNYTELECDIDYSENGDLLLGVRLNGRNPEIENGRPINYNLNISENIPVLLESLRLQDQVTRKIEKQVGK